MHRFAVGLAFWIVLLIFFGGHVKTTNSGLSVPDWPNTYGHFMFSFPWESMVGGIFWEHTHRMIASVAGILTFILTVWTFLADKRTWVRKLALWASVAVLAQGALGGLTVLFLLLAPLSSAHGTLAQLYFCLVVALAVVTSPRWADNPDPVREQPAHRLPLQRLALLTTAFIVVQLIFGAVMRHTESGLAIPDFPLMFGSWLPPLTAEKLQFANKELWRLGLLWGKGITEITAGNIIIHMLHRVWAFVVAAMVLWTWLRARKMFGKVPALRLPAHLLAGLVLVQLALGILTILTQKQYTITTLHVVNGALTLATSLVLTMRARKFLAPAHTGAITTDSAHAVNTSGHTPDKPPVPKPIQQKQVAV